MQVKGKGSVTTRTRLLGRELSDLFFSNKSIRLKNTQQLSKIENPMKCKVFAIKIGKFDRKFCTCFNGFGLDIAN